MKLVVGLGNPGKQYENSRHNVGFYVVDQLARQWMIDLKQRKHNALYGNGMRGDEKVVLLKPQTFMNLSGSSVAGAAAFYKVSLNDMLVILDDLALELGQLRLRPKGSAGGHNGLNDIIEKLGRDDFGRLRIGIGAPRGEAVGHVLGSFGAEEKPVIAAAVERAAATVECWMDRGIDEAMNQYNMRGDNRPADEQDE